MLRMVLGFTLALAAPAAARQFHGTFAVGTSEGRATLMLENANGAITGSIADVTGRYAITGRIEGELATGTVTGSDGQLHFHAAHIGGAVRFSMYPLSVSGEPDHSQETSLVFARAVTGTEVTEPAPSATPRPSTPITSAAQNDAALVGTWMKEDITSDPTFSYVTVTIVEMHADGTYVQYHGGSGGGNGSISLQGDRGGEVQRASWRTTNRVLELRPEGEDRWVPVARYYVEGNRFSLRTWKVGSARSGKDGCE